MPLLFSPWPIAVAAQSGTWSVFARSNAGIVGSNPTRVMDVYVRLFCVCAVLYVGSGLATGWFSSKESCRLCIGLRNWKSGHGQHRAVQPLTNGRTNEWMNEWMNLLHDPVRLYRTSLPIFSNSGSNQIKTLFYMKNDMHLRVCAISSVVH
jgi:hypothetical protein